MKVTDEMLAELVELESRIKAAAKRVEEIKAACKERGTFSTVNYVVIVSEISQTRLEGLEKVSSVIGRETLQSAGLIKEISFQTVKVQAKGSGIDKAPGS